MSAREFPRITPMKPLRILHVTPYAEQAWAYGGIPRIVTAIAREQTQRGHAVTICTTDARTATERVHARGGRQGRWQPHESVVGTDGLETRVFPNLSNRLAYHEQAFLPLGLSRYLEAHAREFDVAHLHACRNLPGVIAAQHLHRSGVPYVLAPNGTAPRLERRLAAKRVFDLMFGRRVLDHAAAVVAVSGAERRQLLSLGVPASKIRLAPNPIALDEFPESPARGVFRHAHHLGTGPVD